MTVSLSRPPTIVSTFDTEPVLAKSPSVQGVGAGAEVEAVSRAEDLSAERDACRHRAADQRLDVGDRRHVGEVAEGQLVGAGAEIDRGVVRQCQSVIVSAPEPPRSALDVRDRDRVGEVAERQLSVPAPRSTEPFETCVA